MPDLMCPLCAASAKKGVKSFGEPFGDRIDCPACGRFIWDGGRPADEDLLQVMRAIRLWSDRNAHGYLPTVLDWPGATKTVASSVPRLTSVVEKMDEAIRLTAKATEDFGRKTPSETASRWARRLAIRDDQAVMKLLNHGCTDHIAVETTPDGFSLRLTVNGWKRAAELARTGSTSHTAFIARSFAPEVTAVFDAGFAAGVAGASLTAHSLHASHKLERIDDQIIAGIRAARVVIADLTGGRAGTYFEAGYAEGLGIPVVYTCNATWPVEPDSKTTWFDLIHFDLTHRPIIKWSEAEDLARQLTDRLLANGIGAAAASR